MFSSQSLENICPSFLSSYVLFPNDYRSFAKDTDDGAVAQFMAFEISCGFAYSERTISITQNQTTLWLKEIDQAGSFGHPPCETTTTLHWPLSGARQ